VTHLSFRALILYGKLKSNGNINENNNKLYKMEERRDVERGA
jgi:hypothetical protein